jgi:hypothetical protein
MKFSRLNLVDLAQKLPDHILPFAAYTGSRGEGEPCLGFGVRSFGEACLVVSRLSIFWDETLGLKDQALWKEFEAALLSARYHAEPDRGFATIYFPDINPED